MNYWLKELDNQAANAIEKYGDVRDFGKSNPFILNCRNQGGIPLKMSVLGANVTRFQLNNGLPVAFGAKVDYGYSTYTYQEFLANTMNSPFQVGILRIETDNPSQFIATTSAIQFVKNEPTGEQTIKGLALFKRLNQFTQDAIEYDLSEYDIVIDGDLIMQLTIDANSNLKFLFYPSARTSFKLLMNEGFIAKRNELSSIPLVPNRTIAYKPIEVPLTDKRKMVIV